MIHSISFKNFFSFLDKATISFEVGRKKGGAKSDMFCDTLSGARLNKTMMVIGPNASGKTNALKALAFLSWFVSSSFFKLEGENEEIPIDNFAFSDFKNTPSEFELVFEHKANVYKYILHVSNTHVIKEELYRKEKSEHFNYLFKRNWNHDESKSNILQQMSLKTEVLKGILRKNVSAISAAIAIKNDFLTEIADFLGKIKSNVYRVGKLWDTSSLGESGLFEVSKTYNQNRNLFNEVTRFLKNIDLGLDGVSIEVTENSSLKDKKSEKNYFPFGIHKVNSKEYKLPFILESSGTKNMYVLLEYLLRVLEEGGIAVIDELEIDIHPHALPRIIDLFINLSTNPKNSQLIFTSHSLEVLNYLEKEQVLLVEKNKNCKSELYRLDEIKGVRRDDNIYAKYMAGAYGAVPNI